MENKYYMEIKLKGENCDRITLPLNSLGDFFEGEISGGTETNQEYEIKLVQMTEKEYSEMPEWSGF